MHKRGRIKEAFFTALKASKDQPLSRTNVLLNPQGPIPATELPRIAISAPQEQVEPYCSGTDKRMLSVVLEVQAEGSAAYAELGVLTHQIERALIQNHEFMKECEKVRLKSTLIGAPDKSSSTLVSALLNYEVEYHTSTEVDAPYLPLDFVEITGDVALHVDFTGKSSGSSVN